MDKTPGETENSQVSRAPEADILWARIVSDPSVPKDRLLFIDSDGRCVGEIVMDAHDETTDGPPLETKVEA